MDEISVKKLTASWDDRPITCGVFEQMMSGMNSEGTVVHHFVLLGILKFSREQRLN